MNAWRGNLLGKRVTRPLIEARTATAILSHVSGALSCYTDGDLSFAIATARLKDVVIVCDFEFRCSLRASVDFPRGPSIIATDINAVSNGEEKSIGVVKVFTLAGTLKAGLFSRYISHRVFHLAIMLLYNTFNNIHEKVSPF